MIETLFRGRIRTVSEIAEISGLPADSICKRYRSGKRDEDLVRDFRAKLQLPAFNKQHPALVAREKASAARRAREAAKRAKLLAEIKLVTT